MIDLKEILESVIQEVRSPPPYVSYFPLLPNTRERFEALIDRCIDCQKKLKGVDVESNEYLDLQKEVLQIESDFRSTRAKLLFMPGFTVVYIGGAVLVYLFAYIDVPGFIKDTLGVDAPEKLITLGVAGAVLYLATSVLTAMESSKDSQGVGAMKFGLRLLLAIVVPIVIVSLFFDSEGSVRELQLSPELLSFACGYSATLVIDLFNKIVEKGSKMIDAI